MTVSYKLWGKDIRVKILTDDDNTVRNALGDIEDKLARIDRNRGKISHKLYEDMKDYVNENEDDFSAGLYISFVSAEIYGDNSVDVIFGVKSSRRYAIDVYYECVLFPDNSFEI